MVAPEGSVRKKSLRLKAPPPVWLDSRGAGASFAEAARAGLISGAVIDGPAGARGAAFDASARSACDALRGVYLRSGGAAGYAVVPLSPCLACLGDAIEGEGRALYADCGSPNLMPLLRAGEESLKAVAGLTAAGVPVFLSGVASPARAEAAFEAYLKGLERLHQVERRMETAALVVEICVGRVDAALDPLLRSRMLAAPIETIRAAYALLWGKVGSSLAQAALWGMRRTFNSTRFHFLRPHGARLPILLASFAGSSREDGLPARLPELLGEGCAVLLPQEEIGAFGALRRQESAAEGLDEARRLLDKLANYQIDLDRLAAELEEEAP